MDLKLISMMCDHAGVSRACDDDRQRFLDFYKIPSSKITKQHRKEGRKNKLFIRCEKMKDISEEALTTMYCARRNDQILRLTILLFITEGRLSINKKRCISRQFILCYSAKPSLLSQMTLMEKVKSKNRKGKHSFIIHPIHIFTTASLRNCNCRHFSFTTFEATSASDTISIQGAYNFRLPFIRNSSAQQYS